MQSSLTFHFKTYEGYGHIIAQSVCMGRPVLVMQNFFRYRTASRFLVPNLSCFEVSPFSVWSAVEKIKEITDTEATANRYGKACWEFSKTVFNWDLEAFRVKQFLERAK